MLRRKPVPYEAEHGSEPSGQEPSDPTDHPLEGGQTDAVDEAQEVADEDPDDLHDR
jgi:hypothetical protein